MIRKIGYGLAGCIIFIAILVATSRLFTPVMDQHRGEIEAWASSLLQMPVTIKQVRLSWYRYHPEVCLDGVTLLNKDTKSPLLQVKNVSVFFSIPSSLWQWKLIPSGIMISGASVNVYQKTNGEIAVQGFPSLGGLNPEPYQSETKFTDVLGWLTQLPSLVLNDVDLHYVGLHDIKRFLTLDNLRFDNASNKHVVLGKAILHQDLPTEVAVTVKWSGDQSDLSKIKAEIYLRISGLSLSQWWKGVTWYGWQINKGIAGANLWVVWRDNALQRVQCTFESYGLDLYSVTDKSTHQVHRLSGDVGWKREGSKQIVAGEDIFIDLPGHLWPATSFYIALVPAADGKFSPTALNVGYIDLTDAQQFLFSSPMVISSSLRDVISALKLKGDIQNLSMTFPASITDWKHLTVSGNFNRLSVVAWHQYPGIENLSGDVKWSNGQGNLSLHSNQTKFRYDAIFAKPISIEQLSGNVSWQPGQDSAYQMTLHDVQLMNSDLALNANGTVTFPTQAAVSMDLHANFTMQKASRVTRYLPMRVFEPGLVTWLNQAFLSGAIQSGDAVFRGTLKDYPFDHGEGLFQITAKPKNLNFRFAPDWPILTNLSGQLSFVGRQMLVDVDHAEIEGITVSHVHGEIPKLGDPKPQVLKVVASHIETDFAQGLDFVHKSPLEKTIGKMFTGMQVTGPLMLALELNVPLSNPDLTTVLGNITFKETALHLVPWNLSVDNMHGQLQFTEKTTTATNIEGELFKKPLTLSLKTLTNTSIVRASIANRMDMVDLENWLKVPFSKVLTGSADMNGQIDFSLNKPILIHLQSNLVGMNVVLPDQYAKKTEVARAFAADIVVQDKQPLRLTMSYGDLLGAALVLNKKNDLFNLTAANLRLGVGVATMPASSGLYISGRLSELTWDKIKEYSGQSTGKLPDDLTLEGIDVTIDRLVLPGQLITNTRVQVTPTDSEWEVTLDGPEMNGQIQVPVKMTPKSVLTAQFQKLNLVTVSDDKAAVKLDTKSMPSISFAANNFSINKMPLGQVKFKSSPNAGGFTINSLDISSPHLQLNAAGDWTSSSTRLQGKASSQNVSHLLNSLGFDAHNFVSSKGKFDFNLNWRAAPNALSLATLNGKASMDLGPGRIVELSQTSGAKMDLGRMLSLFSLQTIPRRLSLDFSDVFQKGYSFDVFTGDFKFESGNAYTTNTHFEGPVARVDIYGRIGLAKKDFDLTMSITPHVTSSIPVAATLLTGQPAIGLAAWAVDKVISSGVSKATTYYYAVNGSWNNPNWNEIKTPVGR